MAEAQLGMLGFDIHIREMKLTRLLRLKHRELDYLA